MNFLGKLAIALCALLFAPLVNAKEIQTELTKVKVEKIVDGLDTPWGMARLPDGRLLVTERDGNMLLIDPQASEIKTEIKNVPEVAAIGQGGLLDIVLDREFATNKKLYFTFSKPDGQAGAGTAIASAKLSVEPSPSLEEVTILFAMSQTSSSPYHFGSRIAQANDGTLFFTIGDRGERDNAQDPRHAAGSVLRINTNGSVPDDNPDPKGSKWLPQIWSIGHRNPQGATINEASGKLWTLAHGAKGGDEINIPAPGKNYGWPVISYGQHYSGAKIGIGTSAPGFEQPIYYWDPSIAPSGLDFYTGTALPEWQGNLFVGALKYQMLVRLQLDGNKITAEERLFEGAFGRIRDVRSFDDGALWFLTDDLDGAIYRISAAQ